MRKAIASVAGPQLLIPCRSYSGDGRDTCAGNGSAVAVGNTAGGVLVASGDLGARGVTVENGVEGTGVGIGPTGSTTFLT